MDSSVKSGNARSQPLLTKENESRRFVEVAGGLRPHVPLWSVVRALLCIWKRNSNRKKNPDSVIDESELEEDSVASSQDELLTPRHSVVSANSLAMQQTPPITTQKVWEDVVRFWRNISFKE